MGWIDCLELIISYHGPPLAFMTAALDTPLTNSIITAPPPPAPTPAPTTALSVSCTAASPLASTFAGATQIDVRTNADLLAALAGLNKPTIINLVNAAAYTLDRSYTVNYNLCIQVGR